MYWEKGFMAEQAILHNIVEQMQYWSAPELLQIISEHNAWTICYTVQIYGAMIKLINPLSVGSSLDHDYRPGSLCNETAASSFLRQVRMERHQEYGAVQRR